MSKFLFNISNHPAYDKETGKPLWSEAQIKAAEKYGEVIDIPFPSVSASETISGIHNMADRLLMQTKRIYEERGDGDGYFPENATFMVQGEARLETALNGHAEEYGLQTICAGSDFASHKEIDKDGNEVTVKGFEFKTFREVNEPGAEPPKPLDLKQKMDISREEFRSAAGAVAAFAESITGRPAESLADRFDTDHNFPTKQEMAKAIASMGTELGQFELSDSQKKQMTGLFQNLEKYGMQVSQGPAFVNAANFPSTRWSDEQKRDAAEYGIVVDLKTPSVPGSASHEEAKALAHGVARDAIMMGAADVLLGKTEKPDVTVMVTWESSAKNMAISELKANDVQPVAICSERNTTLMPDGTRVQKTVYEGFQNIVDREEAHKMQLAQEPEMTPWQKAVLKEEFKNFNVHVRESRQDAYSVLISHRDSIAEADEKRDKIDKYYLAANPVKVAVNNLLNGRETRQEVDTTLSYNSFTGQNYENGEVFRHLKTYLTEEKPPLQAPLRDVRAYFINEMESAAKIEEATAISYARGYINGERNTDEIDTIGEQTNRIYDVLFAANIIQDAIDNGDLEAAGVTFSDVMDHGSELMEECHADNTMCSLAGLDRMKELGEGIPERVAYNAYERSSGEEPDEKKKAKEEAEIGN